MTETRLPFRHSRGSRNLGSSWPNQKANLDARVRGHDGASLRLKQRLSVEKFSSSPNETSDRPPMLGNIDAVAFDVFDPALGNRPVGVVFGFRVGNFLDLLDAIDLEAKMMNPPRIFVAMDESEIEMAVG